MRSRPLLRVGVGAAAAFVLAATAWALLQAVAAPSSDERAEVAGTPAAVVVEVDQGDVDVRAVPGAAGASATAAVRTVVTPERTARLDGDEARLSWTCRLWTTCRADVRAEVPPGVRLEARTDFGDLRVAGPVGDIELETGSGEIEARAIDGRLATIEGRSGDVTLAFVRRPFDVDVEVSSGDVEIAVPAGVYRIEAETRAGDVVLRGVGHHPDAPGRIRADTTAGDVTVRVTP
jgi:hypothetical protein